MKQLYEKGEEMSDRNKLSFMFECSNCHNQFSIDMVFFYDNDTLPKDRKVGLCTCPKCKAEATTNIPIFYWNQEQSLLTIIFDSSNFNEFENVKIVANDILESYLSNESFKRQKEITSSRVQYLEKKQFENEGNRDFSMGIRKLRITPTPTISIDKKYCFKGKERKFQLSKNDISYSSNGLSDLQKELIYRTKVSIREQGYAVNFIEKNDDQSPAVTCGLLSIVFTVGSIIIIPILVNVISDVIADARRKKEDEKKPKLTSKDELSISIYENQSDRVYHFEGKADVVVEVLKECGLNSTQTLSIKKCHTATLLDNYVHDPFLPHGLNIATYSDIAKEYQREFDSNSAVEIKLQYSEDEDEETSEEIISYKASLLINAGEYKAAYWMMRPWLYKATTIEFFYNFALCLALNFKDDNNKDVVIKAYREAIRRYINSPDLKDLELFHGQHSKSDIDALDQFFIDEGFVTRDDDGDIIPVPPKNQEELEKRYQEHMSFMEFLRDVHKYDLEELQREAQLNSMEAECKVRLEETEKALKEILNRASADAMKKIEIFRKYRLKNNISEEQSLEMLLNDTLPEEEFFDKDTTTKSYSEEFDALFKEKIVLEKFLEKIVADRKDLWKKHQFSLQDDE